MYEKEGGIIHNKGRREERICPFRQNKGFSQAL
jgi:1,4-dihydroxy-2-naphthoyl-CoA hydrolase